MEASRNPFVPVRGATPLRLFGRELQWQALRAYLGQLQEARGAAALLVTGMRGSGKSALLQAAAREAAGLGLMPVVVSAGADLPLTTALRTGLRSSLLLAGDESLARRPLTASPELLPLLLALAARSAGVLICINHAQRLERSELQLLLDALRAARIQQPRIGLLATALPGTTSPIHREDLPGLDQNVVTLPPLTELAAAELLVATALPRGVKFEASALAALVTEGRGHPLTLQQLGASAWLLTESTPVRLATAQRAISHARLQLGGSFHGWRQHRLGRQEQQYLRAMAELGADSLRSGEIAAQLGRKVTALAPTRSALIAKELLYSPRYGETAFTTPGYSAYLLRT